jgi:putative multiple sugar transport system permease protein
VTSRDLSKVLRQNVRSYGMYIALVVIFAIFTILTNGLFISSRNISNLLNQSGYIAVLAVGMTLVIIIRHIDLSVGFLSGFLGAVAAMSLSIWHFPVWVTIPLVVVCGLAAGLLTAYPVARLGIPSFVASLAGWLIYRGALLLITNKSGTIKINNDTFNALGNGYIPDIPGAGSLLPGVHKITLLLGLIAIVLMIVSQIRSRRSKQAYNFEVLPADLFVIQLVLLSVVLGLITWVLAGYNGMSWTFVIVIVVVAVFHFVMTRTVLGRHIYAIGGNPEAAELSGINVKNLIFIVFGAMGVLCSIAGMLFASRLTSATTTAGTLFELDAIAAAYIGGVSAAGGVGKVTGSFVGALVYVSLTSGMNLMGTDISFQYVVRGAVLALAVIFDVATRRRASK